MIDFVLKVRAYCQKRLERVREKGRINHSLQLSVGSRQRIIESRREMGIGTNQSAGLHDRHWGNVPKEFCPVP